MLRLSFRRTVNNCQKFACKLFSLREPNSTSARRFSDKTASLLMASAVTESDNMKPSLPVYFLSHGGPPIMEWKDHPAYKAFQSFGREVTGLNSKGLIVLSAHFTGGADEIYVNSSEFTDLVYDFYGFPDHYYRKKFPHTGSKAMAGEISDALRSAGIQCKQVARGLDHGVWVPFMIAFNPQENPLSIPIVQLSLYGGESPTKHIALGKALAPLRQQGYTIIASGQAVHNLRDLSFNNQDEPLPYVQSFDRALEEAITTTTGETREQKLVQLLRRGDARAAHPHFDHILPMYVAVGAASGARAELLFNHYERSLSWAQYRFVDK